LIFFYFISFLISVSYIHQIYYIIMDCFTGIRRQSPLPPPPPSTSMVLPEIMFGKVSMLNGDGSVVTTGTIVPEGQRTQIFGRIRMNPVLKIKSDTDGTCYNQEDWINKYKGQVKRESVYASDPETGKAYAENFQKAIAARNAPAPFAPRTPRPVVAPVQKTVFGMRQPPPSAMTNSMNLAPLPFKFDLPPLPPVPCLPRLI
jgi:hypothetical protein